MTTPTTETAKEVLRGYGRANEAALASLMDVQDWQRIARQELERRATSIVQALDDAAPLRLSHLVRSMSGPCAAKWPTRSSRPLRRWRCLLSTTGGARARA
jgi:hypothetical protein